MCLWWWWVCVGRWRFGVITKHTQHIHMRDDIYRKTQMTLFVDGELIFFPAAFFITVALMWFVLPLQYTLKHIVGNELKQNITSYINAHDGCQTINYHRFLLRKIFVWPQMVTESIEDRGKHWRQGWNRGQKRNELSDNKGADKHHLCLCLKICKAKCHSEYRNHDSNVQTNFSPTWKKQQAHSF